MIRVLRNFLGTAATAALCAFGAPASAIVYDVGFDPLDFAGIIRIDVAASCLTPFPSLSNPCAFDVLAVNFTDSLGLAWFDPSAPETGIGQFVMVDGVPEVIGIQVTIFNLAPVKGDSPCFRESLAFALDGSVVFGCPGDYLPDGRDTGRVIYITRVPEPATAALLGLGLVALAAVRRRKRA